MATLQELLLTPENGPRLIADTQALVDNEISSKGITAAPIKAAYKAVTSFAPGYLQEAISAMLPGMVHQLEPYWADFVTSGGADFGDYLAKRGPEVCESLLAVTDDMAQNSSRATGAGTAAATWRRLYSEWTTTPRRSRSSNEARSRSTSPACPTSCSATRARAGWCSPPTPPTRCSARS